jgi:DNA-directed RNA polymerase specialized sigma24 family protein
MTSEQFDALAVLMGQPDSKSAAAARLVLVEGLSSAEAARRVGITTQGANQAVQRCWRFMRPPSFGEQARQLLPQPEAVRRHFRST